MALAIRVVDARSPEMQALFALRRDVFVVEQSVPESLELDALDAVAIHAGAYLDGELVGALRIVERDATAKVGRVAVRRDRRGSGVGAELMRWAVAREKERGLVEVRVAAQLDVVGFYEKLGFDSEGEPFEEAGIAHRHMRLALR